MTPLESAARALHANTQQFRVIRDPEFPSEPPIVKQAPFIEWDALPADAREQYYGQVRAVLTAIRDIEIDTQDDVEIGMLIRGRAVLPEHDEPMHEDALNCWQAMIDAALEEG